MQAFIHETTLEPDQYLHCYQFEVYETAWRFVSAVETQVLGRDELTTVVYLEVDDYDENLMMNGFYYSGQNVELMVYHMVKEN